MLKEQKLEFNLFSLFFYELLHPVLKDEMSYLFLICVVTQSITKHYLRFVQLSVDFLSMSHEC